MAEMPDVVTLTTISSDWGNDLRDRSVQRYSSVANRTTEHPTPTEGDLSYLTDTNEVFVYDGSNWVALGARWAPVAGGDHDITFSALTATQTDKASVVFTKPAGWATYALVAWGTATGTGAGALTARVEIGASNGSITQGISGSSTSLQTLPCFHSVTAQTASPVSVAVAVAEAGGDASHSSSTIQYVAYRLT